MTQTSLDNLKKIYLKNQKEAIQDFFTFLKYESISTEPSYKPQVLACAKWLSGYIKQMGFQTETWETKGHPVIFGSWSKAGPDKPTLLIYNHYDVQPVDPLDEWKSPPFEPTIRNGEIFARGAQDNKGQCFYVLQALKILFEKEGRLPINVKLVIEGEEEAGSAGLASILPSKKMELKADYLAIVDLGIRTPTKPALTLGIRGIVTMDVEVQGSKTDLHSGSHGGIAYNPIHALVEILSKLRDASGKIAIPGFYDDVAELSKAERKELSLDFDPKQYEEMFGGKPTGGEKSFNPLERNWLRPSVEVNGISGGYAGAGFKTVIPAKAHAKVSLRLVPNQDPQKSARLVANFLEKNAPDGVSVKVTVHPGGGKPVHAKASSKVVKAFAEAFKEVYKTPCEFILEGASIPIVTELALASQSEVILLGIGLPDDLIHAPNEHFGVDRLEKGSLVISRSIELLGDYA